MDTVFAKVSFIATSPPKWICPTCEQGKLTLKEGFVIRPDSKTAASSGEEWFDVEYSQYVFSGMLCCSTCSEHVSVSGRGHISQEYGDDGRNWSYVSMLTPTYFIPPLRVISPQVNDNVPPSVVTLLNKAHEVCWADPDSALNRLRTIVEEVLDFKNIPRTVSGRRLNLHRRIQLFQEPGLESVKAALLAVKYVGNEGSHGFSGIERRELLEVFEVVKYLLEKLFPIQYDDSKVINLVNKIVENKGLPPKSTPEI